MIYARYYLILSLPLISVMLRDILTQNFCKQKWGRAKSIPLLSESSQYATLLLGKTISMVQTFFGKTKTLFGFLSISKTGTKVGLNVMWCHGNFWKVGDTCIPLASVGGNSVRAPSSRTSAFPGKSPRLLTSTSLQLALLPSRHHRYSPQQCYPMHFLPITQGLGAYVLRNANCNTG